jgi:putative redox protein
MAKFTKNAVAVWKDGTAFEVTGGSGHSVTMDGDSLTGMSPMELLLGSLITCSGADVINILLKKRQKVTGFAVRVHGDRADEHPRFYTDIRVTYIVTGHGVQPEAVARAIELSDTKYCSVSAMLRRCAVLTTDFEIHEAEPEAAAGSDRHQDLQERETFNE